jgi:flavodoxin
MADRVLVAYGSKFGATAEIVAAIGIALRSTGLEVDVEPPSDVRSLDAYRAMARKTPPELRDRRERRAIDAWAGGIAAALTG